jgi:hypothetical protein
MAAQDIHPSSFERKGPFVTPQSGVEVNLSFPAAVALEMNGQEKQSSPE